MKLYLAGPDVFRPDVASWAAAARELCARHGHQALVPLDETLTTPAAIYRGNIDLIRACDAVLANLNPFRGCEPDSGTAFEVGFATALGKPVVGYVETDETLVERVARREGGIGRRDGRPVDGQGRLVEDFGSPLNLMLAVPATIVTGGLAAALEALRRLGAPH